MNRHEGKKRKGAKKRGLVAMGDTISEHVADAQRRRLINSEYQRGFMEGQHESAREFAVLIDRILSRYDQVALVEPWSEQTVKI